MVKRLDLEKELAGVVEIMGPPEVSHEEALHIMKETHLRSVVDFDDGGYGEEIPLGPSPMLEPD